MKEMPRKILMVGSEPREAMRVGCMGDKGRVEDQAMCKLRILQQEDESSSK
jgi:hypothetical protein